MCVKDHSACIFSSFNLQRAGTSVAEWTVNRRNREAVKQNLTQACVFLPLVFPTATKTLYSLTGNVCKMKSPSAF